MNKEREKIQLVADSKPKNTGEEKIIAQTGSIITKTIGKDGQENITEEYLYLVYERKKTDDTEGEI